MLFPSESQIEERREISFKLAAGAIGEVEAGERLLKLDPDSGSGYLLLGGARTTSGDLSEGEALLWQGLDRRPCNYSFYLALSELRSTRDPKDALGARLTALAFWKLACSSEITDDIADDIDGIFRGKSKKLDLKDPETYRLLALEFEKGRAPDPPEVEDRLLPYRILNDLQIQAPEEVSGELVQRIRDNSARCLPLWRGALREWARDSAAVSLRALGLIIAWLGEIAEVDVLDDLLDLVTFLDDVIFLHSNWAVWRIGQRFPAETLSKFRAVTPSAAVELRRAMAEQITLLPEVEGMASALTDLLEGFSGFASDDRAPRLLMTVVDALNELSCEEEAQEVFGRYERLLPKKGREKLREYMESKDGFVPDLMIWEIDGRSIEDVCIGRVLMVDEQEDESDGEESDAPEPPRVTPDRNGPCWCGSGNKYKKCHLAADEEAKRSHERHDGERPRPDPFYHTLLGSVLQSVPQVRSRAEMREAHKLYFDRESDGQFGMPGSEKFTEWSIFDFRPGGTGRTVVEEYIRRRPRLPAREQALLESWLAARFGLFEVQRIERGAGVEVKDVFAGDQFFIHDVSSSRSSARWDCILSRVQQFEGRWIFTGSGLLVSREILPQLVSMVEEGSRATGKSAAQFVQANSHRWYRVLTELQATQLAGLRMVNAEGDQIEFSSATYEVRDVDRLLTALAAAEVFEDTTSKDESPGVRTFGWLETGTDGPRRSYGHIEIRDGRLRLECNSRKRLAIGRQLLEKNAAAFLTHERDTFEALQEAMSRMHRDGQPEQAAKAGIPKEVENELLLQLKTQHYATWPDEKLPALGGQTPREAVRSKVGRRAVEDLLRTMENGEDRLRQEGGPAFDFGPIRKTLGLSR